MLLADHFVDAARPQPHCQRQLSMIGIVQRTTGGSRGGARSRVAEQVFAHACEITPRPQASSRASSAI